MRGGSGAAGSVTVRYFVLALEDVLDSGEGIDGIESGVEDGEDWDGGRRDLG